MDDYKGSLGTAYVAPKRLGYTSIEVLHFLKGRKWDQLALNYVHAVRPTYIRATYDEIKTDSRIGRVTVWLTREDVIEKVEQEVEVGLEEDFKHGHDLDCALRGKRSRF